MIVNKHINAIPRIALYYDLELYPAMQYPVDLYHLFSTMVARVRDYILPYLFILVAVKDAIAEASESIHLEREVSNL